VGHQSPRHVPAAGDSSELTSFVVVVVVAAVVTWGESHMVECNVSVVMLKDKGVAVVPQKKKDKGVAVSE
jgi:hypothetical protein